MARLTPLRYIRRQLTRLDVSLSGFLRKFDTAEAEVQDIILAASQNEKLWQLKERRRQNAEARAVIREVFKEADQEASALISDFFTAGRGILQERNLIESQSQSAARRILQDNIIQSVKDAETLIGRRVDDVFRREGLRQALAHGLEGRVEKASRAMQASLQRDGVTAFVDRAGRKWTLSRYVDVAVRTTSIEALNTATHLVLVEQGFDVVQINSVAAPCKICLAFDGKEFSLTGRSDLPLLKDFPPFHGGCRHFIYPNQKTFREKTTATILEVT